MLATSFSTYRGTRERPLALPEALAGSGCVHRPRAVCWRCYALASAYAASMRWASGLEVEPIDDDEADRLMLELPGVA